MQSPTPRSRRTRRRAAAFTLAETLIASLCAATVLMVLMNIYVVALRRWGATTSYNLAIQRANGALERMCADIREATSFSTDTSGATTLYTFTLPDTVDGSGNYLPQRSGSMLAYGAGARVRFYLSDATGAPGVSGGTALWRATAPAGGGTTWTPDTAWSRLGAASTRYDNVPAFSISRVAGLTDTVQIALSLTVTEGNANKTITLTRQVFLPHANPLMARWKLDENGGTAAADASGNGNAGTLGGSPVWTAPGKVGTAALTFNTTNSVSVPDSSFLNPTTGITVSLWVKATSWGAAAESVQVLGKGLYTWNNPYRFRKESSDARFHFTLAGVGDVSSATFPTVGQWVHVAGTYDGTDLVLYYDGVERARITVAGSPAIGVVNQSLVIGQEWGGSAGFTGALDDIRIYNRALTASEISGVAGETS